MSCACSNCRMAEEPCLGGTCELAHLTWVPLLPNDPPERLCGHPRCTSVATAMAEEMYDIIRCDDPGHRYPVVIGESPANSRAFVEAKARC